jgi:hypothetical protein
VVIIRITFIIWKQLRQRLTIVQLDKKGTAKGDTPLIFYSRLGRNKGKEGDHQ